MNSRGGRAEAPRWPDGQEVHPQAWRVADVTFVEIEIRHRTDTQLRVEFECGLRIVVADERQIPLAARLIESLRCGKEALR